MTIFQKRQYNRFKRSADFLDRHVGDFAPGSKALALKDELTKVIAEFETVRHEPKVPGKSGRSYNSAKLAALNALREDLVAISSTAGIIAASNPKFKNTFILPDRRRKNELAAAARQFIKDAKPAKAEFQSYEMNEDFLGSLQSRLEAYEAAQSGQGKAPNERMVATDAVSTLVAEGVRVADTLNVVVRNKYRGNTEVMDEWNEAAQLEFTPRRKKGERAAEKAAKK